MSRSPNGLGRSFAACLVLTVAVAHAQPATTNGHLLVPPKPIITVKAVYPPDAQATGLEGSVTVLADLDASGVVDGVQIAISSGSELLDEAALAAARRWRFTPALDDGKPIASQVRIPFHFHHVEVVPTPTPPPIPPPSPSPSPIPTPTQFESTTRGGKDPPSVGVSDYHIDIEKLSFVPHGSAAELLKLAPGILLTNEGSQAHANQIFLRGFDTREGQDIEFSVDGIPINESGNLHGNGYADTNFIIPELVQSFRLVEGTYNPRQGNYAVAGSADFHLGLTDNGELGRGLNTKFTVGNFGTYRMLMAWAPPTGATGTFAAVELYQTKGFGQNRDGRRGSAMMQWEGHVGSADLRLFAQAYIASFHSAGIIRDDDYRAGRIGFYGTYDPSQGDDAQRYSVGADVTTHTDHMSFRNLVFGIVRPLRLRQNTTGFLLDPQTPFETPHAQRGDLMDTNVMEETVGLRGSARLHGKVLHQEQELELGYYARGDFVASTQQRIEAATGHPYRTDFDLQSTLGDIGMYANANLRFARWLALRGGARGDVYTYDINNKCAVPITTGVSHPSMPVDDVPCLSQEDMGAYREPNQRVSTVSAAVMPRGALLIGPFKGFAASADVGQGVRTIDPQYIQQDGQTPFARLTSAEGGLQFERRFRDSMDLSLKTTVFYTHINNDLVFDPIAGRNTLAGPTTRIGSASLASFKGPFWVLQANLTYASAKYDDTHLLVPYVPDLVFRADGVLFGDLPWWKQRLHGHPLRGTLAAGFSYVGPRPLPYGARSDTIATLDGSATVGWWFVDFSFSAQNLLDRKYRLGEYDYVSDFHTTSNPTLVPTRAFTAGAPRQMMFSIKLNYGGRS